MTDRKTDRELLHRLVNAPEGIDRTTLMHRVIHRFRDLLDRVDIVNDRAELHPVPDEPHAHHGSQYWVRVGYAKACKDCKEDLINERS